ncbi:MAG: DUF5718 family protein [Treponema sp.]|nr:DUF5718 family protein [Treponema sp.]
MTELDFTTIPAFGVAGNFTGHLEQAGEAADFANVKTAEAAAPKALFPTYIPAPGGAAVGGQGDGGDHDASADTASPAHDSVPAFLRVFPFDSRTIIFPKGEEKLQIEPECAIVFDVEWKDGLVASLSPVCFGASNDCSIRKAGARKISEKKNWGPCSKGFSAHTIPLSSFSKGCALDGYRIASFLIREGKAFPYGEDSPVAGYSYIWEKLTGWIIDRLNNQKDEGPAEDVHSYLTATASSDGTAPSGKQDGPSHDRTPAPLPARILVSIGATRYTDYGEHNFLRDGDVAAVVLYPEASYSPGDILRMVEAGGTGSPADGPDSPNIPVNKLNSPDTPANADISILWQTVRA